MINRIYRLVDVKRIEIALREVNITENHLLIRPDFLSICAADQRYYQGKRKKEVLQKKLPLALIHEGIGTVLFDPKNEIEEGTKVVLIPNMPITSNGYIKENYAVDSLFLSSSADGFMQDILSLRRDRVVSIPEADIEVYTLSELVSVAFNAIETFERAAYGPKHSFGIWGDGSVGFVLGLVLRSIYPESEIYVFGKHSRKLQYFTFAEHVYFIDGIPGGITLDHCFDCVGGNGSELAVNQMIEMIRPQGCISLLGVCENPIPINTRVVLEKGLQIIGDSRSGKADFEKAVNLVYSNKSVKSYLKTIVSQVIEIKNETDIHHAFVQDQMNDFKTILKWMV